MEKEKAKDWLHLSMRDIMIDPSARRDLAKMMLSYCLEKKGTKSLAEIEDDFAEIMLYFTKV